ncbi:mCG144553, partial [Mus musculus]
NEPEKSVYQNLRRENSIGFPFTLTLRFWWLLVFLSEWQYDSKLFPVSPQGLSPYMCLCSFGGVSYLNTVINISAWPNLV